MTRILLNLLPLVRLLFHSMQESLEWPNPLSNKSKKEPERKDCHGRDQHARLQKRFSSVKIEASKLYQLFSYRASRRKSQVQFLLRLLFPLSHSFILTPKITLLFLPSLQERLEVEHAETVHQVQHYLPQRPLISFSYLEPAIIP